MKKGISFYFGFAYEPKKRAKDVKSAGFDCVMTNQDPRLAKQNGTIRQQMKFFKQNGLGVSSLHMQYKTADLPHFFMDDKIGKNLEKTLIKDLKTAKKYHFSCVVVHLVGELSEIGIERFNRVLAYSEKVGVPLALENLNGNYPLLQYFFKNYSSPYVKFCYDSGHNHCFYPDVNFLGEYGDRLICVHLHDNMGTSDDHTLNEFGSTDWQKVAKQLASCPEVCLDYELLFSKPCNLTYDVALQKCFKQAEELEKMIEKERKKLISKQGKNDLKKTQENKK